MAQRDWTRLGERQRKRYLSAGGKQGLSPAQVVQHYESGGNLSAWRGQARVIRTGVSERKWRELMKAARLADLGRGTKNPPPPGEVLEILLHRGYQPDWILRELARQHRARSIYQSTANREARRKGRKHAGNGPGKYRWDNRDINAPIELYYYH